MRFRRKQSEYLPPKGKRRGRVVARTLLGIVALAACLALGLGVAAFIAHMGSASAADPGGFIKTTVTIPGHPRTVHIPAHTVHLKGKTIHVPAHTVVLPGKVKTHIVSGPLTTINGVVFRTETISRTITRPGTTITKPGTTVTGPTTTILGPTTTITGPVTTVTETLTTTVPVTVTVPTTIITTVTVTT